MSLSIVVPSKNAMNLCSCVGAINQHDDQYRIVIIDDGICWDGEHCELGPGDAVVQGFKPFVFARNVNLGIRMTGDDDVIVMNDDALLETPGGFSILQWSAHQKPEYGIIAATCNNVGNQNQLPQGTGLREEPRQVCFVCVLIPRRTIETVGYLDERFIHYGMDDDDYCLRVRKAGLKIGIHDGCYVDHGSLTSSYRGAAGAGGDYRPNLEIFKAKWGHDNFGRPA